MSSDNTNDYIELNERLSSVGYTELERWMWSIEGDCNQEGLHLDGMWVVDKNREKDLMHVYETLPKVLSGTNIKITYNMHQPFAFGGSVLVYADKIHITDMKTFLELTHIAGGFSTRSLDLEHLVKEVSVPPASDHMVMLDFSFNDLAKKVGD